MLINAIEQDYNMVGIMLALFLGLRRSEIAGLRWQDVDLENDKVFIRNTVTRFSGIIETQQTKSESSQRDLSIPLHLHNCLVKVKAHQERNRELCGYDYADDVHVCVWDNGTPQSPEYPYLFKREEALSAGGRASDPHVEVVPRQTDASCRKPAE